ncbi:hypothetical protein C0989_004736 [Termitomyces sp. Mn162]|nr:hypothetical protein C0989_004736 [Termitomyces sp. Mn162]
MSNTTTPQVYFDDIRSVSAAAVFAALYFIFLVGFIVQWLSETVYNRNLLTTPYSPLDPPMSRILRFHALYRLVTLSAIVIGSVGLSQVYTSDDSNNISAGNSLYITSAVLFLVLIVYLACQTVMLSRAEARSVDYSGAPTKFITRHGTYILMGISTLLFIREAYDLATARDRFRANNEHLWYPLLALPEILAVLLFAIPGLVPARVQRCETVTQVEQEKPQLALIQSAPACVECQVSSNGISDSPPQLPSDLVTSKSDPGLIPP